MYTIKTRIFSRYIEEGWANTMEEAIEIADEIISRGWRFVRIIHPNGTTQEMGCKDEDNPIE
jgi:hypothetical protein